MLLGAGCLDSDGLPVLSEGGGVLGTGIDDQFTVRLDPRGAVAWSWSADGELHMWAKALSSASAQVSTLTDTKGSDNGTGRYVAQGPSDEVTFRWHNEGGSPVRVEYTLRGYGERV